MIKYSLTNCDSTLGENIRYMMHKYKFDMHQWYGSITLLFNKIDLYNNCHTVIEDKCTVMAIMELCNIRDGIDQNSQNCPANMSIIRELCDIRDGRHIACDIISKTEVCSLLDIICTE